MARSARAVVQAFLEAINKMEFDRAAVYLGGKDFHYKSPIHTHRSGEDFISDFYRLEPILKRLEIDRILSEGNEVCALITIKTHLPELASTRISLWAAVSDDRMESMEMVYDARAYEALFEAV